MNFKRQLFYSSPLFFVNNNLKFNEKLKLENILSVANQLPDKCFTLSAFGLHFQEICIDMQLVGMK